MSELDAIGLLLGLIVCIVVAVVVTVPHYFYWKRTGHSGWWCLLMLVPVVNIAALWVLAFKRWPTERDADGTAGPDGA